MRRIALVWALLLVAALTAQASHSFDNSAPYKAPSGVTPPDGQLNLGDTIALCIGIGALPFSTTGSTALMMDDYDEACPYIGSTSPDYVYCWEADFSGYVDIHTCQSSYDTKLYVYENEYTPGEYLACNDDNPDCPGPPYRSWITEMPVTAGNTYYIVVDGYGGDYGDFLFNMYEVEGPVVCDPYACPPSAFDEGEPDCYDGYVDTTNVGCNGTAGYIFQHPPFPTAICGTSGNYDQNAYRDMDWFEFTINDPMDLAVCVCADFQVRAWILDGNAGCAGAYTIASDAGPAGTELCVISEIPPGTYYAVISTDGWLGIPCGSPYWATVEEYGVIAVEETSWGTIKARYR
jgi:hypothetical protein